MIQQKDSNFESLFSSKTNNIQSKQITTAQIQQKESKQLRNQNISEEFQIKQKKAPAKRNLIIKKLAKSFYSQKKGGKVQNIRPVKTKPHNTKLSKTNKKAQNKQIRKQIAIKTNKIDDNHQMCQISSDKQSKIFNLNQKNYFKSQSNIFQLNCEVGQFFQSQNFDLRSQQNLQQGGSRNQQKKSQKTKPKLKRWQMPNPIRKGKKTKLFSIMLGQRNKLTTINSFLREAEVSINYSQFNFERFQLLIKKVQQIKNYPSIQEFLRCANNYIRKKKAIRVESIIRRFKLPNNQLHLQDIGLLLQILQVFNLPNFKYIKDQYKLEDGLFQLKQIKLGIQNNYQQYNRGQLALIRKQAIQNIKKFREYLQMGSLSNCSSFQIDQQCKKSWKLKSKKNICSIRQNSEKSQDQLFQQSFGQQSEWSKQRQLTNPTNPYKTWSYLQSQEYPSYVCGEKNHTLLNIPNKH